MAQGAKDPPPSGAATRPTGEHDLVRELNVAASHFRAGRLTEAKALYNRILRDHPGSGGALHFLGLIAHAEGDHARAIELLEAAIAQTGTVAFFHGNLAEVYRSLGRRSEAAASCRRALELIPVYPEALNTLGAVLYEEDELDEAEGHLLRAIEFKPDFAEAHANLGNVHRAKGRYEKAVKAYERALRHSPRLVEVYAALGTALRKLGKGEEAVAGYRRALEIAPKHPAIWCALGIALSDLGRPDQALSAFERAIDLRPGYPEAHINKGNALRRLGRVEDALGAYQRAIDSKPEFAEAHCSRGFMLERMHRLEEARAAAMAALEQAPEFSRAKLLLARLDRRSGALQEARDGLETLLQTRLEPAVRARASVELGHTLDSLGQYSAAFAAFEAGQAEFTESEATNVDRRSLLDTIDRNLRAFTGEGVAAWRPAVPEDDLPSPIFLVGFPRSGNTLVEQILASCPEVKTSGEAPVITTLLRNLAVVLGRPVGGPDLGDLTASEVRALRSFYWEEAGHLAGPGVQTGRFVDKFPLNIVHLGLIHRLFPEAKILVALRDPRDVCLSCFFQGFTPNEGMVHFVRIEDTALLYKAVMELWLRYRDVLNMDYVEFRYEDLVTDLEGTARKILNFLDLDWDEQITQYHDKARQRYITTPSYQGVAQPVYSRSVGRWRNYESQIEPVLGTLRPFVETFGYA